MSEQAAQVPLIELARAVPNDLCGEWQEIDGLRAWHHAPIGRYVHELCDQITELTARAERLQAELAEAHGYGSRLFLRLNPQCEVFDNMPGLMTQFDNYIAGQLQDIAAEKAARERAEQELANFGDRISAAIGTNDYLDPPDGGGPELAEQVRRMRTEVVRLKEIAVLSRRFMRANWCTAEYYQLQRELLDKLRAALGGLNG